MADCNSDPTILHGRVSTSPVNARHGHLDPGWSALSTMSCTHTVHHLHLCQPRPQPLPYTSSPGILAKLSCSLRESLPFKSYPFITAGIKCRLPSNSFEFLRLYSVSILSVATLCQALGTFSLSLPLKVPITLRSGICYRVFT